MFYYEKYSQLSDEETIQLIQDGDKEAVDYLLEKYKNLVKRKAKTLYLIDGDKDDLIQEGMIGLYKAIRDFDLDKEAVFYSFAELCITRQIYSAIKFSNRKKNIPLNTYISLNEPANQQFQDNKEECATLEDIVPTTWIQNPEQLVIDKESTNVIEYELGKRLSKFEKEVLYYYLQDKKYNHIAQITGRDAKSIDNAIQRIRSKLNQLLKELQDKM